jgi:Zn-dependent protease/CBS domain-containing protein
MKAQLRIGRVAGIDVGLNWSVLGIFALLAVMLATDILPAASRGRSTSVYWAAGIVVALAFFLTLLAHEVAHALMARHYGVRVKSITLWMLGGVTELEGEPETPRQHLAVAVIGPVVSLAAGAACEGLAYGLHVAHTSSLVVASLAWLGGTNVLIGIFNLLPAAPLDGGRVLQALVWMRVHNRNHASLVAARAGRALGQALIVLGLLTVFFTTQILGGVWLSIIGWFVYSVAKVEEQASTRKQLLGGVTVADVVSRDLPALPAYQDVDSVVSRVLAEPHDYYPVVSFDGAPVGVVSVDALVRVPEDDRRIRKLADVMTPIAQLTVCTPDQPITQLLAQGAARQVVVVVDHGVLLGLITPRDFTWALRRAALGRPREPVSH